MRADGAVLVRTRPQKGLLGGMTEIPGTPWSADFDESAARRLAPMKARYRRLGGFVAHGFTHFELQLSIYVAEVEAGQAPEGCRWTTSLDAEALPSLMRKAIEAARAARLFHVKLGARDGRSMARRGGPRIILTEGAVRVLWGERVLTIRSAPALQDVEEPADFVVDMDQIVSFDAPHESEEISVEQLQAIAQAIEAEFDRLGLVVAFE